MTFEILIGFVLMTIAAIAGVFAYIALQKAEKRFEHLQDTICAQEETIYHQRMVIADLGSENAKLKSKVSILQLEIADKGVNKK